MTFWQGVDDLFKALAHRVILTTYHFHEPNSASNVVQQSFSIIKQDAVLILV